MGMNRGKFPLLILILYQRKLTQLSYITKTHLQHIAWRISVLSLYTHIIHKQIRQFRPVKLYKSCFCYSLRTHGIYGLSSLLLRVYTHTHTISRAAHLSDYFFLEPLYTRAIVICIAGRLPLFFAVILPAARILLVLFLRFPLVTFYSTSLRPSP